LGGKRNAANGTLWTDTIKINRFPELLKDTEIDRYMKHAYVMRKSLFLQSIIIETIVIQQYNNKDNLLLLVQKDMKKKNQLLCKGLRKVYFRKKQYKITNLSGKAKEQRRRYS
jgi:hypothetical protein